MPFHADDCAEVKRINLEEYESVPVHHGRRVLPEEATPAPAWLDGDEAPGEHRLLLDAEAAVPRTGDWGKAGRPPTRVQTKLERRWQQFVEAWRPPYFIISVIVVIVCVHRWGGDWRTRLQWSPGAWRREPWRLLTYGCLHADSAHLALNALVALFVGWRLEHEQGWARVSGVWCGGLVAGALGTAVLQPTVSVVGASAAVYALLTAHLPNVCLRFGHIPLWWFRPLSVVVLSVSEGVWYLACSPRAADAPHVAWSAHVLGAAAGLPLGFVLFKGENSRERHVAWCKVASASSLAAGLIAGALCLSQDARDRFS